MKIRAVVAAGMVGALVFGAAHAAERNLADALAAAGAATASKGNTAQAKDLFYTALAHDENCPDALFELAKLIDKEGDSVTAGELFQRAALLMAQEGKPAATGKRAEAEKRLRVLSPVATKLASAFEEYAQDLEKVVKKLPDPLTESTALERVTDLQLPGVLPPEKLPKFYTAAQEKEKEKKTASNGPDNNNPPEKKKPRFGREPEKPKAEGATAPEIEKELKALGWNTVTGVWTKKSPGVYEATDAKLEVQKTNGTIDFTVVKGGGEGTVKATVRTDGKNDNGGDKGGDKGFGPPGFGWGEPEMPGYGIYYRGKDFKDYGYGERGGGGGPGRRRGNGSVTSLGTYPIPESAPKNRFIVKVDDTQLDFFHNDVRKNSISNAKLTKTGTFVLDVIGTVTIENPRAIGQ